MLCGAIDSPLPDGEHGAIAVGVAGSETLKLTFSMFDEGIVTVVDEPTGSDRFCCPIPRKSISAVTTYPDGPEPPVGCRPLMTYGVPEVEGIPEKLVSTTGLQPAQPFW